jgi:hypothetical protein
MIVKTHEDFDPTDVDPAFATQHQAGAQPTAPTCNPHLPVRELVPLNPALQEVVDHASHQTDWKKTPIG